MKENKLKLTGKTLCFNYMHEGSSLLASGDTNLRSVQPTKVLLFTPLCTQTG